MNRSKKTYLTKFSSFFINLIEGVIAILAAAVIYSFVFEAYNKDHDVGLGVFVLFVWIIILFTPNIFLRSMGKMNNKDMAIFQIFPFILGALSFVVFQLLLW